MGHIDEISLRIENFKKYFGTFYMDRPLVKPSNHLPPHPE
jgi:hypothetical protein